MQRIYFSFILKQSLISTTAMRTQTSYTSLSGEQVWWRSRTSWMTTGSQTKWQLLPLQQALYQPQFDSWLPSCFIIEVRQRLFGTQSDRSVCSQRAEEGRVFLELKCSFVLQQRPHLRFLLLYQKMAKVRKPEDMITCLPKNSDIIEDGEEYAEYLLLQQYKY